MEVQLKSSQIIVLLKSRSMFILFMLSLDRAPINTLNDVAGEMLKDENGIQENMEGSEFIVRLPLNS